MNVKTISLHHLRTQIALVGQEPRLFAGSIRDNICLGLEKNISTEELYEALEIANAKSFVDSLPQVYTFITVFLVHFLEVMLW